MRFSFAILAFALLGVAPAKAAKLQVSTADLPEVIAMARLMKEAYRQIGHDFDLVVRPAKRSLVEVNMGKSDAELARVTGLETIYPNLVRVPEPVFTLSISAMVRADSRHRMSSWSEIGKLRIGYPRGYRILDIRTQDLNATKAGLPKTVAKMVKGGRVDVGIVATSDALRLAPAFPALEVLSPPMETVTLYHYVNVKHRRMVPKLEKILIELNDSGRAKEIIAEKK